MSYVLALVTDAIAITVLAGALYFRRHRRRDLMLSYVALNVGVLAVTFALGSVEVGIGLGIGLFGILSIIRLRSDQIAQQEIAYYFVALALGLLSGLRPEPLWLAPVMSALLLAVMFAIDSPRLWARTRRATLTLDRAFLHEEEARVALEGLLGARVHRVDIMETDLVRDMSRVDVRFSVDRPVRNTGSASVAFNDPAARQPALENGENTAPASIRERVPESAARPDREPVSADPR